MAAPKYYIDVNHAGLGKFQRIQGTDQWVVERRAAAKSSEWERQWERRRQLSETKRARQTDRENRARDRDAQRVYVESRKREAEAGSAAAEAAVENVSTLLAHTLTVDDRVDFDALKDHSSFSEPEPAAPPMVSMPHRPQPLAVAFVAPLPTVWRALIEFFSPSAKRRRLTMLAEQLRTLESNAAAESARLTRLWEAECARIENDRQKQRAAHRAVVESWQGRRAAFETRRHAGNDSIDLLKRRYGALETDAIEQYCELVLSASEYPDEFPQTFSVEYRSEAKLLVVEYVLPLPVHLPKTKAVKYVQARDELVESELPEGAQKKLYDSAVYQITLRSLHELFEADTAAALSAIAFNGVVETIDSATGKPTRPCIITVQASKGEFMQLNLAAVEPRACFRSLKGIGSAQLHALAPVPPIVRFNKDDSRFVEGRAVLDGVTEGQNIACMPWEDFEHLIRDLFQREFAGQDAEVRVTRASRDGGVDAVIFDPDPIRGGKLVVQAKRYTKTVGVSAVRDLYGAMTAERASKGILVTTATFGYDSYEFAKDKPITLLDGGGLLHLLQKHGVPARIDLQQARNVAIN